MKNYLLIILLVSYYSISFSQSSTWTNQSTLQPATNTTERIYRRGGVAIGYNSRSFSNSLAVGANTKSDANSISFGYNSYNYPINAQNNSISGGLNCRVLGSNSMALGNSVIVTGINSAGIGNRTNVSGNFSFAIGNECYASGGAAFSGGQRSSSDTSYAWSYGYQAHSEGLLSFCWGRWTKTRGNHALSMGSFVETWGNDAVTIGRGWHNNARLINQNDSSMMVGFGSRRATFFIGPATSGTGYGHIQVGEMGTTPAPMHRLVVNSSLEKDPLQLIGVQATLDSNVQVLVITPESPGTNSVNNGTGGVVYKTSISDLIENIEFQDHDWHKQVNGSADFSSPSDISSDIYTEGNVFQYPVGGNSSISFNQLGKSTLNCSGRSIFGFKTQTRTDQYALLGNGKTNSKIVWGEKRSFQFTHSPGGTSNCETIMQLNPVSNNQISTWPQRDGFEVEIFGDVWSSGSGFFTSDRRFKNKIKTIGQPGDIIRSLRGTTFDYKSDKEFLDYHFASGPQYGFIAQELEEVLPELVSEDRNGFLAVNYQGVIPILVEAYKEQANRIDQLEKEIKELQLNNKSSGSYIPRIEDDQSILFQNTPNPFSESTIIQYQLAENVNSASIVIYDLSGKQVMKEEIDINTKPTEIEIGGFQLAPGMYLYSLLVDGQLIDTKRMVMVD